MVATMRLSMPNSVTPRLAEALCECVLHSAYLTGLPLLETTKTFQFRFLGRLLNDCSSKDGMHSGHVFWEFEEVRSAHSLQDAEGAYRG